MKTPLERAIEQRNRIRERLRERGESMGDAARGMWERRLERAEVRVQEHGGYGE